MQWVGLAFLLIFIGFNWWHQSPGTLIFIIVGGVAGLILYISISSYRAGAPKRKEQRERDERIRKETEWNINVARASQFQEERALAEGQEYLRQQELLKLEREQRAASISVGQDGVTNLAKQVVEELRRANR